MRLIGDTEAFDALRVMATAIDERFHTGGHIRRVADDYGRCSGRKRQWKVPLPMSISQGRNGRTAHSGLMHDIGKLRRQNGLPTANLADDDL